MLRRTFLKSMAIGSISSVVQGITKVSPAPLPITSGSQPNILLILVDDLGYGDLSCYGGKDIRTPNIDRLIKAGMRIDPFYANCPVCSPTRAAILTGRFPALVGVPGVIRTHKKHNWGKLASNAVMLPEVLQRAGYQTGIIGKWHLGLKKPDTPNHRGFEHFHGFIADMMDDYYTHRRGGINFMRLNEKKIDPKGHATDLFTQWTVDYLNKQKDSKDPFFLYLAYNAPHTPIQPPAQQVQRVKNREKGIDPQRAKLVALIEHLDDGIGKVISALQASGQADNTLVIFTSDNGGQLNVKADNGPLNGGKQNMLEGGIRVPMGAVWPGRIKPGTASDNVLTTMDLYPTICQAAGARFDHEIDGVSFLPTLLGNDQIIQERFLFFTRLEGQKYHGQPYYAVIKGPWKLLQNTPDEPLILYNIKDDPEEKVPLAKNHRQYKILHKALQKHIEASSKVPWQRPGD